MTKKLAVFGATGQQGRSVIDHVLNDPELAQQYKIRAITRDVDSEKARGLEHKNVEVVFGDTSNPGSIENALTGVHTVFIMTVPSFGPDAVEAEFNIAKMIADTAVKKGVQYIIFSTLPPISKISGDKYTQVTPFDAKAKAEEYIRSLLIKSSFCSLGSFMENLQAQKFLAPKLNPDGTWVYCRPVPASAKLPLLNAIADTGKFVGAILAEPDKYEGKTLCAAVAHYSHQDIVDALSKNTGKKIYFKKVSWEDFRASLPWIPDVWMDGFHAQEEFGYFGPGGEDSVAWAALQARGRLTTLGEYLAEHPFKLE